MLNFSSFSSEQMSILHQFSNSRAPQKNRKSRNFRNHTAEGVNFFQCLTSSTNSFSDFFLVLLIKNWFYLCKKLNFGQFFWIKHWKCKILSNSIYFFISLLRIFSVNRSVFAIKILTIFFWGARLFENWWRLDIFSEENEEKLSIELVNLIRIW